jgi:hypothetical protein
MNQPSDIAYMAAVDKVLVALACRPGATLEKLISEAQGAFPTVVLERAKALGIYQNMPRLEPQVINCEGDFRGAELHPLDYEWYFTKNSAEELASIIGDTANDAICLSTPTVACELAKIKATVVLLDHNPLILSRLPLGLHSLDIVLCNLFDSVPLKRHFSTVFFDAPWYLEYTSHWLSQASQVRASRWAYCIFAVSVPSPTQC